MELGYSLLAAFGAMLCWGFGDFFIQRAVWKVGDVEALAYIGIFGAVALLPFVKDELPLLFSGWNLLFLAALGVVTFVAAVLSFEAYKHGKLSVVEVTLEVELPVTVFLGMYILKESVSATQLSLIALVFAGIVLIAMRSAFRGSIAKNLEKGVIIGVLGAVGIGIVNFMTAIGSKSVSPLMVVWFPWVVFTVLCVAYLWSKKSVASLLDNAVKYRNVIVAMGFFDTVAWLLFALALTKNGVAITTAITESYPVIGVLLGAYVNREQVLGHQWLGAAIAMVSCVALAVT